MGNVESTLAALKLLFQLLGTTQTAVGAKLGIEKKKMSKIMTGKQPLALATVELILETLAISWATFGLVRDLMAAAGDVVQRLPGRAASDIEVVLLVAEMRRRIREPATDGQHLVSPRDAGKTIHKHALKLQEISVDLHRLSDGLNEERD